jgi:uncharacterized membrane protein (UPF0127 family)
VTTPKGATPWRATRIVLAALAVATLSAGQACAQKLRGERLDIVTTAGVHHFKVEVADTPATRERGLMFRKSLAADRGMLFDFKFKTEQPVSFWMKNTLIPLDIVFIGANGRIVSIARNATPLSETPIASAGPVLDVLELRGGRAAEIEAAPGDRVREGPGHR